MAITNYAELFAQGLAQKYASELKSNDLYNSNPQVSFLNAKTIKLPRLTLSGYKDHNRNGSFNAGTISNDWEPKALAHDRDVEFFVDSMDIDETNLAASVANIQNVFETEQAIPERDAYTFSKLFAQANTYGSTRDTTALTAANILQKFDDAMQAMDDAEVPEEGRIWYVTPAVNKLIKNASGITRMVNSGAQTDINRIAHNIDDVQIKVVPSARMRTQYDFTNGFTPATGAGQINFILVHPSAVVGRIKHEYMRLFTPGTDSRTGDGYIYQNRAYWDVFLLERKKDGLFINYTAGA